jgi:ribosomal protein S18 acetylase RimI-like enzyme
MTAGDLPDVAAVADRVHPAYPEDLAVAVERLALYPAGCRVLAEASGALLGYVLSHPWHSAAPPALDSLLGALPSSTPSYYIHDLALLPAARGTGAADAVVRALASDAAAAGFRDMQLVAVNGSTGFWQRHGFRRVERPELAPKLRSYDEDACFMVRDL